MVDKVRPNKLESSSSGGTENDLLPTATDPAEDHISCKGVAFAGSDNTLLTESSGGIVLTTGGVERGRVNSTGTGSGVFGGFARTFLLMGG